MTSSTRRGFTIAAGAALAAPVLAPGAAGAQTAPIAVAGFPPDPEVRRLLIDRVDVRRKGVGMVVGLVGPEGRRVVGYGATRLQGGRTPDGSTLFGVGSIGKMFTAVLLGCMVVRGEVRLDDPAQAYLPKGMKLPVRGRPITLADLATHTSGLPFMPPGVRSFEVYTAEALTEFLAAYELPRDARSRWEYSNTGYILLGLALSERAGLDYETLLRRRVTGPLGMRSTFVSLPPSQASRLAQGYDQNLKPVAVGKPAAIGRIGAIYTTAVDLIGFISMADGHKTTELGQAFALLPRTRRPAPSVGEQALGWEVMTSRGGPAFLNKDGIGRGYGASAVFDPAVGRGVVVLSNVEAAPSDLARHLLRPAIPLTRHFAVVAMDPALLQRFVGVYQVAPGRTATAAVLNGRLFLQITGLPNLPLSPVGDAEFFNPDVGVAAAFRLDSESHPTALVITRPDGTEVVAARLPGG